MDKIQLKRWQNQLAGCAAKKMAIISEDDHADHGLHDAESV